MLKPLGLVDKFKYWIERFLIRGPIFQLLFVASLISLLSLISGLALLEIEEVKGGVAEAAWWAFLHMSDPGYLGDNQGTVKRLVATFLTLAGYVFFMGALVAILTQWFIRFMKQLEAGYSPFTSKNHIAILGYTSRTPVIIRGILSSKSRLKRFMTRENISGPKLVILNEAVDFSVVAALKSHVGKFWDGNNIIFRTGNPLRDESLRRINIENAATVIIPSNPHGKMETTRMDSRVIKILMSLDARSLLSREDPPSVVAEILDPENLESSQLAYRGPMQVFSSRHIVAQLVSQNIDSPGLSYLFQELLSHEFGCQVYLKKFKSLIGQAWREVYFSFEKSLPIGLLKTLSDGTKTCQLVPSDNVVYSEGDEIVFVSNSFSSIEVESKAISEAQNNLKESELIIAHQDRKVLIMGWSSKVPLQLETFSSRESNIKEVDVVSIAPIDRRLAEMGARKDLGFCQVNHLELDYTRSRDLGSIDFKKYDNIFFTASDRIEALEDADARSILGYLLVKKSLESLSLKTPILIELHDSENEFILKSRKVEIIVSPLIVSYMMSNVALRLDLGVVFDELFSESSYAFCFIPGETLGLTADVTFAEVKRISYLKGISVLGIRDSNFMDKITTNPAPSTIIPFSQGSIEVVALTERKT